MLGVLTAFLFASSPTLSASVGPLQEAQASPEAQEAGAPPSAGGIAAPDTLVPEAYEAAPRANAVVDSAEAAIAALDRLGHLESVQRQVHAGERRSTVLAQQIDDLWSAEYVRSERLSAIHDGALGHANRLAAAGGDIADRLETLGEMRRLWQGKRALWERWRSDLRSDPDYPLLAADVDGALQAADRVLERIAVVYPEVLDVQREVEALRHRYRDTAEEASALRVARREALLTRTSPLLLSGSYFDQLEPALLSRAGAEAADAHNAFLEFVPRASTLLLIHALLAIGLALMARRLRVRGSDTDPILARPVSIGIFVATAMLGASYAPAPGAWTVMTWTTLGITGTRIAAHLLRDNRTRTLVYVIAALYPILLVLETIGLPAPMFRPLLLALTVLAAILHWGWVRHRGGPGVDTPGGRWAVRLGGLILAFAAVVNVVGFDQLAFWVIQASVAAAFIVFAVILLIRLTHSSIQTMLRTEPKGRFRFVRRIGYQLANRLTWLVRAVLWLSAVLYILDVWEIAPSPLRTWNMLTSAGFNLGSIEITLGRVLLAAFVLYLVTLLSWLARASVETAASERWKMDRGMSNSISRILHYCLIALGILLAARALGFGLSNFAIIAGALGVGIGFGLQNVVNNFVSGLILLFERPIRVGDVVTFGEKWGTIKHIGLRATTISDFDESETIVPNADLVAQRVTNWTLSNSLARLVIPVGVAYGSDVAAVLELLRTTADEEELVVARPEPQALFRGFGESSLDFHVRVWLADVRSLPAVQSTLSAAIERRLREEGIEIPFPQRDLHVRSVDGKLTGLFAAEPESQ